MAIRNGWMRKHPFILVRNVKLLTNGVGWAMNFFKYFRKNYLQIKTSVV